MEEPHADDLGIEKSILQAHDLNIDSVGIAIVHQLMKRTRAVPFFAESAPCIIVIEACASSHHWGPELTAFGHAVKFMPHAQVKPFVKRQKNDATDAEAICEAARLLPATRNIQFRQARRPCRLTASELETRETASNVASE